MQSNVRRVLLFGLFLLSTPIAISAQERASGALPIVAGHVLGTGESLLAGQLLMKAAQQVGGISVEYSGETTDGYDDVATRFADRTQLTDLVFLYAGSTPLLGEIQGLVERGLLQPLDAVDGYDGILNTADIYENLLTPARMNGHLWAVPIRVCPPCLVVEAEATVPGSWAGLVAGAQEGGFRHPLRSDPYMLWLSMVVQRGSFPIVQGQYDVSGAACREAFADIQKLFSLAKEEDWSGCRYGMAVPNDYVNMPELATRAQASPFPVQGSGQIFTGEATWYVGMGAHATGPVRTACLKIMSAIMSPPVQMALAQQTYSPPVRPSIAASKEFRDAYPAGSPQAVFAEMTPRLAFRKGTALTVQTEPIVENAVLAAVKAAPDAAAARLAAAAEKANALIAAPAKP